MRTLLVLSIAALGGCYNPTLQNGSFACNTAGDSPQCPDGYTCGICPAGILKPAGATGCCVKSTGGGPSLPVIMIPKSGAPYTGPHTDPGLNDAALCPDASLEPNDGPDPNGNPLGAPPLMPDQPNAKIINMAICPSGNNPGTGNHDVDFYKVDNSSGPSSLTLMAQVFYDISMGDLDIGIYDSQMNQLVVDGTAVTNGCAAAMITNGSTPGASDGIYYVVVAGANNVDANKYDILIRSFAMAKTCPTTP